MTLIDIIETGNLNTGRVLDDASWLYEDIDIDERLDKEVLIDCLFDECGAMTAIYSTTRVFKKFSDNFFKKYRWNIGKMLDTMELEYNPLGNINKNWTETTSIGQELETAEEHQEGRTKINTGTQNVENTGTQGTEYNDDTENKVSAMNSDDYQADSKSENGGSNTRTDNLNELRTDDLTETIGAATNRTKNETLGWDETDTHTESGSDRVVFQDLIKKEREVAKFSIYNWISRMYAKELFLMVY